MTDCCLPTDESLNFIRDDVVWSSLIINEAIQVDGNDN